jgi:flagellar hook assembly protein FlgD
VDGKLVRVLAYGQRFPAGRHVLARDGRNTSGLRAGSGNYFVQVQAGAWSSRQKVVCLQ